MSKKINIHPSWYEVLKDEFEQDYLKYLRHFIREEHEAGKTIYPHPSEIFNAFNYTPFDKVKVVIIGQDPYHGPGQAHGLCFSVKPGVKTPPSLANIFKEQKTDLNIVQPNHGCLTTWAQQGVLLLNNVLTVEKGMAASHKGKGWEQFTDKVIEILDRKKDSLIFVLWGAPAQKKGAKINSKKHTVLKAPHPSPLSSYRGFFGSKHFSQINQILTNIGSEPIEWQLPINPKL